MVRFCLPFEAQAPSGNGTRLQKDGRGNRRVAREREIAAGGVRERHASRQELLERDVQGKMIKVGKLERQMGGKEAQWRGHRKQKGTCGRENEMEEQSEKAGSEQGERC